MKLISVMLLCLLSVPALSAEDDIVMACRRYLSANAEEQLKLEAQIERFRGDVGAIVSQLSRPAELDRQDASGVLANQLFKHSDLKQKYNKDLLHFFVPENYQPSQPIGLLIFMHGGGRKTPREFPLFQTGKDDI